MNDSLNDTTIEIAGGKAARRGIAGGKAQSPAYVILGTATAFLPACIMRWNEAAYMFFCDRFATYPGDLWNFFTHYLGRGLRYIPEYPAGMRFAYEALRLYAIRSYTLFFALHALVFAAFAVAATWLMWLILADRTEKTGEPFAVYRLWYFWILAPSFLFYGTFNYDLPVVFLIVLAVFLHMRGRPYWAASALAIGTVIKVFPIFLLPALVMSSPRRKWLPLSVMFATIVIACNLPYAIADFHSWIYPYVWQISSNITVSPAQGTYWWLIYPFAGKLTGWLSIGAFTALYALVLWRFWSERERAFLEICLMVMVLFLLTDRIYSPQYDLYLLPFLVLTVLPVNKRLFYAIEVPNLCLVLFLFFMREHVVVLQALSFVRYSALIVILITSYRASRSGAWKSSDAQFENIAFAITGGGGVIIQAGIKRRPKIVRLLNKIYQLASHLKQ